MTKIDQARALLCIVAHGSSAVHKDDHKREPRPKKPWWEMFNDPIYPPTIFDNTCRGCLAKKAFDELKIVLEGTKNAKKR